jgi:hypothetical protein
MAVALDYRDSILRRSDLRAATLDGADCQVVRRSLTRSEASPSEGVHQSYDGVYWVDYNHEPTIGSALVAETIDFRVLTVDAPIHYNYWTAGVRGLAIDLIGVTLNDKITRYPAVQTIGAYGQRINSNDAFDVDFLNVPCRIQPQPTAIVDTRGRRAVRREYHITVNQDVELRNGDKLRDSNGVEYSILAAQSVKRIDESPVIVAFGVD